MTTLARPAPPPFVEPRTDLLSLLADMSRAFSASLDIEATLAMGLRQITDALDAEASSLFLLEEPSPTPDGAPGEGPGTLVCRACTGPVDITGLRLPADRGIVGRTIAQRAVHLVRDVAQDPNFNAAVDRKTGFTTRSILSAPLSVQDQRLGAIQLINKRTGDGRFAEGDVLVLEALAAAAALAIDNARKAQALVEQERLQREIDLAANIQKGLLPADPEDDFPVAGANHAARGVSGDFYDFVRGPDGRIWFALADVSGKGMNAALLMAQTSSLFRLLAKDGVPPGRLLRRLNDELVETTRQGMFVTMAAGTFDPATGQVCFANAGHEPVLVLRPGGTDALPGTAPPLGIVPGLPGLEEVELALGDGALYAFSDGLTEGYGADGAPLEADGVWREIARLHDVTPPRARARAIAELVARPGEALRDDVTVLVVDGRPSRAPSPSHESPT